MSEDKTMIIGGGIVGLSIGWQLTRKGRNVEIYDKGEAGKGAAWVSAGMLAPQAEMGFEEIELFKLCRHSLELYPEYLSILKDDSGIDVQLDRSGSLMTGFNRDDSERLRRLYEFRDKVGLPVKWITGTEAREIEPLLSPKCTNAIWIPEDAQIDNLELLRALKKAFNNCGGTLIENSKIDEIIINNSKIKGIGVNGDKVDCENLVVSAGAWSRLIPGIPDNILPPVRPVKGQIITLEMNDECNINPAIRGQDVYLVPKSDGRLLVGASNEDLGFDTEPTAGEIFRLLERGWETIPAIYDLHIKSIDVGLRPGSRDHNPILGKTFIDGMYFATGHYRNGVLLAPITGISLCELIINGSTFDEINFFNISRFEKRSVA